MICTALSIQMISPIGNNVLMKILLGGWKFAHQNITNCFGFMNIRHVPNTIIEFFLWYIYSHARFLTLAQLFPAPLCPKTKLSGLKICPKGPDRTESMVPGSKSTRTALGTYLPPENQTQNYAVTRIFISIVGHAS
mgnify:CR=1 FL=1